MNCLYLVIPAYNEEENIEEVIKDWYPIVEKHNEENLSRLVILDDGSTDHTYDILQKCAKDRPLLIPVHKNNTGHGATLYYGYHYAIENGADYIFQTDSDRQTLPEEFEAFWNMREQYAAVIGYRQHREDGFFRVLTAKGLRAVLKICFGVKVTDANTPYRLMQAEALKKELRDVPTDFHLCNALLCALFIMHEKPALFIPITFRPRQGGKNSINIQKILRIGIHSFFDFAGIAGKLRKNKIKKGAPDTL